MLKNLLKSELGRIIISCILGLGLASLFKKVCVDGNCLIIKSPPEDKIRGKIFKDEGKCFKYHKHSISCPAK